MKIFAVISVARQVDGEYCLVKVDKAFKSSSLAENFVKDLSKKYAETVVTPNGISIECVCERGIFEIDVEE
jgi:hypothetical protein